MVLWDVASLLGAPPSADRRYDPFVLASEREPPDPSHRRCPSPGPRGGCRTMSAGSVFPAGRAKWGVMTEPRYVIRLRGWVATLPPMLVDGALAALVLAAQLWPFVSADNPW